jgi:AraC-like DNA-binding protein
MGFQPTQSQPDGHSATATEMRSSESSLVLSTRHLDCMHPAVRVVLMRVSERLSEQWTLNRAASLIGYNPSYVCFLFRSETGMPFHEWVEACRITRSAHLLIGTRKLIADIAAEVGYSNSAFGRAFKRRVGISPRKFRSDHRRREVEAPGPKVPLMWAEHSVRMGQHDLVPDHAADVAASQTTRSRTPAATT